MWLFEKKLDKPGVQGLVEVTHGQEREWEIQLVVKGVGKGDGVSVFCFVFLSALGLLFLRKGHCIPTGCQELSKQLGIKRKNKMDDMPPEAELVFEKKDGKVPMTPGVKETPKGTCHLHFLCSPPLINLAASAISTPAGQLSAPWGSPSFQT